MKFNNIGYLLNKITQIQSTSHRVTRVVPSVSPLKSVHFFHPRLFVLPRCVHIKARRDARKLRDASTLSSGYENRVFIYIKNEKDSCLVRSRLTTGSRGFLHSVIAGTSHDLYESSVTCVRRTVLPCTDVTIAIPRGMSPYKERFLDPIQTKSNLLNGTTSMRCVH